MAGLGGQGPGVGQLSTGDQRVNNGEYLSLYAQNPSKTSREVGPLRRVDQKV